MQESGLGLGYQADTQCVYVNARRWDVQRGVDLPALDVTYFTSLSYYILLLFGLRGVLTLIFREATIDETQMYRQQMGLGGGAGGPMGAMANPDPNKAFEAERAALDLVRPGAATMCLNCVAPALCCVAGGPDLREVARRKSGAPRTPPAAARTDRNVQPASG